MLEDSTDTPLYPYCKYCEESSNFGSTIDHRIPQTGKSEGEFTEQEELQFTPSGWDQLASAPREEKKDKQSRAAAASFSSLWKDLHRICNWRRRTRCHGGAAHVGTCSHAVVGVPFFTRIVLLSSAAPRSLEPAGTDSLETILTSIRRETEPSGNSQMSRKLSQWGGPSS